MSTASKTKTKRFERNADAKPLPEEKLTPQHIDMLRLLNEHRVNRTSHLAPSHLSQRRTRKLRELYNNKYIDKLHGEDEVGHGVNPAALYVLDRRGAKFLNDNLGEWATSYSGTKKAGTKYQLTHTLHSADLLVAVKYACDQSDGTYRYLSKNEILTNKPRLKHNKPLKLEVESRGEPKFTVADALFGIEYASGDKRYFFVEIDRGTMPIKRNQRKESKQTDVHQKYVVYGEYRAQKYAIEDFGFKNFGVLFITSGGLERPKNVLEDTRKLARKRDGSMPGVPSWLFGHYRTILDDSHNVLDAPFIRYWRGELQERSLLTLTENTQPSPTPVN